MPGYRAPITVGGHNLFEVVSALQKSVRRGLVDDALYWAVDMDLSGYENYLWRRLRIMASEDVGLADPTCVLEIGRLYDNYLLERKKDGSDAYRLFIIHAVLRLATARKSRTVDSALIVHYADHVALHREIPDVALDHHTAAGKRKGRGFEFFFDEATQLHPVGTELAHPMANGGTDEDQQDPYKAHARRLMVSGQKMPELPIRPGTKRKPEQAELPTEEEDA